MELLAKAERLNSRSFIDGSQYNKFYSKNQVRRVGKENFS